jgi:hypothetical protein
MTAVNITARKPNLSRSRTISAFEKIRAKRLMDKSRPTQTTGTPIALEFMGRKGYRNASPKLANASANAANDGALNPVIFCLFIYPQQDALTAFGFASTPQHALAPKSVLHTPVSGSSSSTLRAASISPSIAATIERTCS